MLPAKFSFCLVAFAVCLLNGSAADEDERIVNGQEISIEQAPYMVQLRQNGEQFCGGSMVASNYVVTAAHCMYTFNVANIVVVASATTLSDIGIQRKVIRYIIHPEYNPSTMHTDIAVFQLNAPIFNIPILTLCGQPLKEGDMLQVSGWGRVTETTGPSYKLRTVMVPVRSQATCFNEYGHYVQQHMFCATGLQPIGSCRGDSGGPAVYNGQLCGLVSFSYKCGQVGHTDAYTNVYNLRPFIEKFMSGN